MKFSILIPVYNVEEFLQECLESVMSQSYKNFEVILVDDGSTDKSGKICDSYKEKYPDNIKVVHKVNQGLISARRVGIDNADGDYCIFVDSDDFVERDLLEKANAFIEKNRVDLFLYSYQYIRNGERADFYPRIADDGKIWVGDEKIVLYEKLIAANDVTPLWTKAVKTEILKKDPIDYTVYYGKNMSEDILQTLHILTAAESVGYMYQPLYLYRINENSVSRSFRPETIQTKNSVHVYDKMMEYLSVWKLNDEEHRDKVNARWFNNVMYMFSRHYEESKSKKERTLVLTTDWDSLLPVEVQKNRNKFEVEAYQNLYKWLKNGNHKRICMYFFKKNTYKLLRQKISKVLK